MSDLYMRVLSGRWVASLRLLWIDGAVDMQGQVLVCSTFSLEDPNRMIDSMYRCL